SQPARRIAIVNNLFDDIGAPRWGGGGTLLQLLKGPAEGIFDHNTALNTGNIMMAEGEAARGLVFQDNIVCHTQYGFAGAATAPGTGSLDRYFPGAVVKRNVIVGGRPAAHPGDNYFPGALDQVGFADRARGDYRLGGGAKYHGRATDGADIGVDMGRLAAATTGGSAASAPRGPVAETGGRQ